MVLGYLVVGAFWTLSMFKGCAFHESEDLVPCTYQSFETFLKNRWSSKQFYKPFVCSDFYCLNGGRCCCRKRGYKVVQTCDCPPGFGGTRCEDVCADVDCGEGVCVLGSNNERICICNKGFWFDRRRTTCVPDACRGVNCGEGVCVIGSNKVAVCICNKGFWFESISKTCIPNACTGVNCGEGVCVIGSNKEAACVCNKGFWFNSMSKTCVPSQCQDISCGNGVCVMNKLGQVACICEDGYGFDSSEMTCVQQCPHGTAEFIQNAENVKRRICYYAVYSSSNQAHSASICQQTYTGGNLAIIPNQDAMDFVSGPHFSFASGSNQGFWIGVNDKTTEGTYVDSEGNPVTYTNWRNDQPNDPNSSQDCVVVFPRDNYKWQDKACSESSHRQALCSINIDLP